jgi:hypothetical protein
MSNSTVNVKQRIVFGLTALAMAMFCLPTNVIPVNSQDDDGGGILQQDAPVLIEEEPSSVETVADTTETTTESTTTKVDDNDTDTNTDSTDNSNTDGEATEVTEDNDTTETTSAITKTVSPSFVHENDTQSFTYTISIDPNAVIGTKNTTVTEDLTEIKKYADISGINLGMFNVISKDLTSSDDESADAEDSSYSVTITADGKEYTIYIVTNTTTSTSSDGTDTTTTTATVYYNKGTIPYRFTLNNSEYTLDIWNKVMAIPLSSVLSGINEITEETLSIDDVTKITWNLYSTSNTCYTVSGFESFRNPTITCTLKSKMKVPEGQETLTFDNTATISNTNGKYSSTAKFTVYKDDAIHKAVSPSSLFLGDDNSKTFTYAIAVNPKVVIDTTNTTVTEDLTEIRKYADVSGVNLGMFNVISKDLTLSDDELINEEDINGYSVTITANDKEYTIDIVTNTTTSTSSDGTATTKTTANVYYNGEIIPMFKVKLNNTEYTNNDWSIIPSYLVISDINDITGETLSIDDVTKITWNLYSTSNTGYTVSDFKVATSPTITCKLKDETTIPEGKKTFSFDSTSTISNTNVDASSTATVTLYTDGDIKKSSIF